MTRTPQLMSLLLSLLPPSCMVVPSSELVNISSPNLQIPQHHVTNSTMDILLAKIPPGNLLLTLIYHL